MCGRFRASSSPAELARWFKTTGPLPNVRQRYNVCWVTIPPVYARAARTMGSEGFHKWTRVILPAPLPFLTSGMKQGWAFAWRSLTAAEIYVTILTGSGLGHLLHYGRELNAMDQVIGIMLVILVIGLLADKALFAPWELFLHRRWGTGLKPG